MTARLALGVVLLAALLVAGCGQKGPLYLPDDEAAAERYDRSAPADDAPADEDSD
ncbi:lipoprotein-attachment site-containing protein [Billgrantia gudaonensis]|uniref:Lipoprotein-attachment site-containing protein n=1 Tax=Billgrantia gudaonensis TaxID=376427 RepID=A0A1G8YH19_9GAMM|nr:lipoprotein [Halomonas gudaonensis]SDK02162.1 lipoprotein-attachment site-containing protein [Halomonas gudaonensis]